MKKAVTFITSLGIIFAFYSFNRSTSVQDPWKAPAWSDTLRNPFQARWGANAMSPQKVIEAQEMYNTYCATCHGKTGNGDGSLGAGLPIKPADFHSKMVKDQKDGALFWKLGEGRGAMPSYKQTLSEEKRWQLIAYVRQLGILDNAAPGRLKVETSDLSSYKIKQGVSSGYFPVSSKIRNVIKSESEVFMVDTVIAGLKLPWSMVFLPDQSMLIAERSGNLLHVKNGKLERKPISGNVPKELRDMKLHPRFNENGLIYISYYISPVKPEGGYTALMSARLVGDKLTDEKLLYRAGPFNQGAFFYGSKIALDGKGHIYFTVGITGERKNAQDLSNHAGKTMRLNEDGSIPEDNPFVKTAGALPEIYSYGHRMHQGLFFDPASATLMATEFGELGGDELNVIKKGANYGWPQVTFSREYTGVPITSDSLRNDIEAPVHHWTFAPSDLARVSGKLYPSWEGDIFIGGLLRKSVLRVKLNNGAFNHDEIMLENIGRVRDVKLGPDKLLYFMTEDSGVIIRLIPVQKNILVKK